jgi:hypothetical protein
MIRELRIETFALEDPRAYRDAAAPGARRARHGDAPQGIPVFVAPGGAR